MAACAAAITSHLLRLRVRWTPEEAGGHVSNAGKREMQGNRTWVPRRPTYQWHSSLNWPIRVIYSLLRRTVQDCPIRIMLRGIKYLA